MKTILLNIIFLALAGCTTIAAYEGVQARNRLECSKLPPSQYEECINNANKSYEEYKHEREEAIEDKK